MLVLLFFFFSSRRRHTRWTGDWSSDVCSSDLDRTIEVAPVPESLGTPYDRTAPDGTRYVSFADWICPTHCVEPVTCPAIGGPRKIGRASCRERVEISGVSVSLKKENMKTTLDR